MANKNIWTIVSLIIFFSGITLLLYSSGSLTITSQLPSNPKNYSRCIGADYFLSHVYYPYRLKVLNPCLTVSGTVMQLIVASDGDFHINLEIDPRFNYMLNDFNVDEQDGYLVLEAICANPVIRRDAIKPCTRFVNNVTIPNVGDYVNVTGQFVLDTEHGWNELHPVYKIEILRTKRVS